MFNFWHLNCSQILICPCPWGFHNGLEYSRWCLTQLYSVWHMRLLLDKVSLKRSQHTFLSSTNPLMHCSVFTLPADKSALTVAAYSMNLFGWQRTSSTFCVGDKNMSADISDRFVGLICHWQIGLHEQRLIRLLFRNMTSFRQGTYCPLIANEITGDALVLRLISTRL